jgi:predicted secreted protein
MITQLLIGSLFVAGTACNLSSREGKVEQSVVITKADQDQTVKTAVGGQVTVKLTWSPGTGYDWILTKHDPALLQQQGEATSEPSKEPMPGAPETRIFQFKALKAGNSALEFQSRRVFEKQEAPREVFRVQVAISQ